jgi:hypothetical protein
MKKFLIFAIIILVALMIKYSFSQTTKITCSVETSCSYTPAFRISDLTDAHAELSTQSNYPYIVCCRIDGTSLTVSQEISGGFIGLSTPTDAHVEAGSQNNYGYHLEFRPGYGDVFCEVADSCQDYDTCLVSISDLTNAHVGDCTTNPYQKKICCTFGSLVITLDLNASKAEWGDDIKVWGRASKNNLPLQDATVYLRVNKEVYCTVQTNSTGDYSCIFKVKRERIDNLNVSATVVDPTSLKKKTAYKTLSIIASFGYEDYGKKEMVCEEMPKVIQNPDGSIDVAMIKVCVWK